MITDLMFTPLAEQLLACFCTQLAEVSQPPDICCMRAGEEVPFGLSLTEDECCAGMAWVRVASITPEVPGADFPVTACGPMAWGLQLELGVVRCTPVGTAETLPTCDQWTALHRLMMEDAAAMRRAVLCCWGQELVEFGGWTPVGPQGMCAGGTMTVTTRVLACDEC